MKQIKLYFYPFDFTQNSLTAKKVLDVANHPNGWCKHVDVCFIECKNDPHVVLRLVDNQHIAQTFPGFEGFSVTRMDVAPRQVFLNLTNIQNPPRDYTGTRQDYLLYAVQHELGHAAFGITFHSKPTESSSGKTCSTMYQQTRGTQVCKPGLYFTQDAIKAAQNAVNNLSSSSSDFLNMPRTLLLTDNTASSKPTKQAKQAKQVKQGVDQRKPNPKSQLQTQKRASNNLSTKRKQPTSYTQRKLLKNV